MNLGSRRRRWLCGYKHTRRIPGRTWRIHPLLPRRTISSHPCLPLYLYTCHRRSFVHRRGERKREIHASLNNPWPTLIRIFTRRNNIRPTVPADSPAIFYVRIIPTLRLPLSLQLADPYRFRSSFSLPPRLFHVCIPLVSRRISLFFLLSFFSLSLSLSHTFPSPSDLLLRTRLAVAYHANARDHVLFMPYLRPLSLGNPTIFGYYLEILIRDGNYVGF